MPPGDAKACNAHRCHQSHQTTAQTTPNNNIRRQHLYNNWNQITSNRKQPMGSIVYRIFIEWNKKGHICEYQRCFFRGAGEVEEWISGQLLVGSWWVRPVKWLLVLLVLVCLLSPPRAFGAGSEAKGAPTGTYCIPQQMPAPPLFALPLFFGQRRPSQDWDPLIGLDRVVWAKQVLHLAFSFLLILLTKCGIKDWKEECIECFSMKYDALSP